jgi:UDP-N-acetyl-D-mannosaminuronate dehydrogenase
LRSLTSLGLRMPALSTTYKPDVDDTQESPAIAIAPQQACWGDARILLAAPNLTGQPEELASPSDVSFCKTLDAVRQGDIVAVLVSHLPFWKVPREKLTCRFVIDATGLTPPAWPACPAMSNA